MLIGMFSLDYAIEDRLLKKGCRKTIVIYYYEKIFKLLVIFYQNSLKFSLFPTQCPNKDNPSNSGVKS